jgi:hypothetical protein
LTRHCPFCHEELPTNLAVGTSPCPHCGNIPGWDERPLAMPGLSRGKIAVLVALGLIVYGALALALWQLSTSLFTSLGP